ncbi:hypothetical protein Tco_1128478 [Tanacetum coccineum]
MYYEVAPQSLYSAAYNILEVLQKQRSRTHKLRRLYKIGLSAKVISSDDEASLSTQEDASKPGRKILDIDADEDITLDITHVDTDPDMFGVHDLHGDEVFIEIKERVVNAATTITKTATTTVADEVKDQGLKDKGKEKIIELEKPLKKKEQVLFDEQEAIRLQAQFDEEARVDKVETDYELALRLQQEEQEELTIEEKSKLFQQLLEKRRKFFVAKRELFDKAMKRVNTFVDFRIELVEGTEREESFKRDETIGQESSSKRAGDELEQEKAKKQKIDDDQEEAKLKELMEVISDEEGVAIDAIP